MPAPEIHYGRPPTRDVHLLYRTGSKYIAATASASSRKITRREVSPSWTRAITKLRDGDQRYVHFVIGSAPSWVKPLLPKSAEILGSFPL